MMINEKREHKRMNKKGAEMAIGTIVIIILALVVLVVIIYGFSQGWDNLFRKIGLTGGGKVNVQDTLSGCNLACSTNQQYAYCEKQLQVIFKDGDKPQTFTCLSLQQTKGTTIGLDQCMGVTCPTSAQKGGKACSDWKGVWVTSCDTTQLEIPVTSTGTPVIKFISDNDIVTNNPSLNGALGTKKCCVKKDKCDGTIGGTWTGTCDVTQYDVTTNGFIDSADVTAHVNMKCCVA